MRQKEADHCNNNSVIIQRNNDATINNTKMTTTTNNTSSNKDSISDQQTKQTTATSDSNATQQTNYDSKPDSFAMVSMEFTTMNREELVGGIACTLFHKWFTGNFLSSSRRVFSWRL